MADNEEHYSVRIARMLEPIVRVEDNLSSFEVAAQLSIAFSLKRIADVLTNPTNEWGENFAEAIGGNIRRALREMQS
jgi:hypothetical protein